MDLIIQALLRLDYRIFDMWGFRALFTASRTLRRPKAALALLTCSTMLIAQAPATPAPSGQPVYDNALVQTTIYNFSAQGIRDRIAQLWKENQDNARWVTDIISAYRSVKMARSAFESLATFDLAQNVNVIDLLPQIDLVPGNYFGGPEDGFETNGSESKWVSLRFKMNPSGGIARTLNLSTLPKFKPKLRISVDQLASQLANLDFDAIQMVQYRDPNGNVGEPIDVGKAVAARLALWDELLKSVNDWVGHQRKEEQALQALRTQQAAENQRFYRLSSELRQQADKEDAALRARVNGGNIDLPSTYDQVISPRVALAQATLQAQQAMNARELQVLSDQIRNLKKAEEKRQAAVQTDAQVTEVLAQVAAVQQAMQKNFKQILDKYKVKRQDNGEKAGGGLLPLINLSSKDLDQMKLPQPAREEIDRMMAAGSQALNALAIKLQGQKMMAENMATIDGISKDLAEATNRIGDGVWASASVELRQLNDTIAKLDKTLADSWNTREDNIRQEANTRLTNATADFTAANKRYFDYLLTKKSLSAAGLVETLLQSYGKFFRTMINGRSIGDVMGPKFASKANEYQAEMDLYFKN